MLPRPISVGAPCPHLNDSGLEIGAANRKGLLSHPRPKLRKGKFACRRCEPITAPVRRPRDEGDSARIEPERLPDRPPPAADDAPRYRRPPPDSQPLALAVWRRAPSPDRSARTGGAGGRRRGRQWRPTAKPPPGWADAPHRSAFEADASGSPRTECLGPGGGHRGSGRRLRTVRPRRRHRAEGRQATGRAPESSNRIDRGPRERASSPRRPSGVVRPEPPEGPPARQLSARPPGAAPTIR